MPESRHRRRRTRGRASPSSNRRPATTGTPYRSRNRKTNWLYVAVSGLIAVLVIGGFAVGSLNFGSNTGTATGYEEGVGIQHEIMSDRPVHVPDGQNVEYNSVPPTSGDHWDRWSNCGFFEEELADERIVHNLEHSNIVVSYNLTGEDVDRLRDVFDDIGLANTMGVARFYSEIPPGTVALSAWGVSDTMQGIDEERIRTFFETYAGNLGPEGNISCLNTGVNP